MMKFHFFFLLFLIQVTFSFSQKITGKLIYLIDDVPTTGNIYLNGYSDKLSTESIQKDGTFVIQNLKNISTIEIVNVSGGSIILTGYDYSTNKEYNLGNLYFINNPYNTLYHVVYKTKIGYCFKWLTEGFRTKRWHKEEVKKNYKILLDKYDKDGKTASFLKKYTGREQILELKSLSK